MSHVATVEIEVKDLPALAEAAKRLGLEFVQGQKTYRWFGEHVGDYPLPPGFAAEDLGKCDHALRIAGADPEKALEGEFEPPYEIGVVRRRDGRPGYTLMWDFWGGGFGLKKLVGNDCNNLKREYAAVVAARQAQRAGFRVTEQRLQDGAVRLILSK